MQKNVGLIDRYLRITAGSAMLSCGTARSARGHELTGLALSVLGGMLLADGILGTCMMYMPLNINTRDQSGNQDQEKPEDNGGWPNLAGT